VGLLTKDYISRALHSMEANLEDGEQNSDLTINEEVATLNSFILMNAKTKQFLKEKQAQSFIAELSLRNMSSNSSLDLSTLETFQFGTKYSIVDFMATNNTNISKLLSVRCDGTAVNIGIKDGVIRFI
jgi:chaperone required for assembly of F1-ATPase